MSWLERVTDQLAEAGLNAWGVADGRAYEHLLPGCRSVVVFGSGGRGLWEALVRDLRARPAGLTEEDHPVDQFVARALATADPDPDPTRRWVRCAGDSDTFVDFRPLALEAGLGWHSKLGLLMHPRYGPWLGLRAACFTTDAFPVTGALGGAGPCAECPAPCIPACPGGAMRAEGIDIRRCAASHDETDACASTCHSREACPEGAEHRYGPEQVRYHYDRATGRRALADRLRLHDERSGAGPFWDAWSDPG